jgi:GGDEF domain-containing protein
VIRDRGLSTFDPATGAVRLSPFLDVLKREENRARRCLQRLRVLEVRIGAFEELDPKRRGEARRVVSRALFAFTRDFDTVGQTGEEGTFAVILPAYEREGVEAVGNRIRDGVNRTWAGAPLALSFRFVDPDEFSSQVKGFLWKPEAQAA